MRIKNLLIIIAIVAAVLLIMRYVRQVKDTRRGYNYVSSSRVAINWLLVILLVGSLVGIGVTSFTGHKDNAAPVKSSESSSAVEPTADDDDDESNVVLKFKKTARMNDNGEAKVKFLISAKTKVVIKGHRSGVVVKTFKPSKGDDTVTRSFTFDMPGTYDITATRGDKKVVKHLKVKGQTNSESSDSSSTSSVTSQSSSSDRSSSTSTDESDNSTTGQTNNAGSNRTSTGRSNAGYTGGSHYHGGSYGGGHSNSNSNSSNPGVDRGDSTNTNQGTANGDTVVKIPDDE